MPRRVDAIARRRSITDAAARLIAADGLEAATLREVASEAGLTTGAVTHYFADKRELMLSTFHASLAGRRADRSSREALAPGEALRAALEGALPIDDDRRRHWMVTVAFCAQSTGDDALAAAQQDAYREFRSNIAALVRRCGLAKGAAAVAIAERLIAAADGIAIQALFDPSTWTAAHQRATLATLLDLIAA